MGRYREAPWGFDCPYKNACPHLGMSTTWASHLVRDIQQDAFRDGHSWIEAEKEIRALSEQNEALSARVAELEGRLKQQHRLRFKPNQKSKEPAKGPEDSAPTPRQRGAPIGHPPWRRRKPDHIDRRVTVPAPVVCPHCETEGLAALEQTHTQLQEDIVLQPRTVVTEYVHQLAYCPCCRREVFECAEGELRNCEIGPTTKAAAVYLRHEVKLSYRDVQKVFAGLFGMPFVPASAMAFTHRSAEQSQPLYQDLRNKIAAAHLVHADETHWRIDGQSAYLWYAGNEQFGYFQAERSRGADVAVSIFGSPFAGNLVADSYAAYNAIDPNSRQACLAHLIRKAREIAERIELMPEKEQDAEALGFCRSIAKFMAIGCRIDQRRRNQRVSFTAAKRHIPRLQRVLDALCTPALSDAQAENLRQRLTDPKRDAPHLFTFLDVKGMPPTNNHAEQALRLAVIFRKISFGSRSLLGAQATATNLSMLSTAKRQGRNQIALLRCIFLRGPDTPLPMLYQPDAIPPWDSS